MVTKQSIRGYTLAQGIALGEARCDNPSKKAIINNTCLVYYSLNCFRKGPQPVVRILPPSQARLATTLWDNSCIYWLE